jgi:hypothetical protein
VTDIVAPDKTALNPVAAGLLRSFPASATKDDAMDAFGPPRTVVVELELQRVPFSAEEMATIACARCGEPLSIVQPESKIPRRLIAACEQCGRWVILEVAPDREEAWMITLPDPGTLQPDELGTGTGSDEAPFWTGPASE